MFFSKKKNGSKQVDLITENTLPETVTSPKTKELYYIDSNNQPSVHIAEEVDYRKDSKVLKDFFHNCNMTATWSSFNNKIEYAKYRNRSYSFYKNNENIISKYLNQDFVLFLLVSKKEDGKKIEEIITILEKDVEDSVPLGTHAKIFSLSLGTEIKRPEIKNSTSSSKESKFVDDDGIEYLENMVSK